MLVVAKTHNVAVDACSSCWSIRLRLTSTRDIPTAPARVTSQSTVKWRAASATMYVLLVYPSAVDQQNVHFNAGHTASGA